MFFIDFDNKESYYLLIVLYFKTDREEGEKHSTEIAAIDTTSEAVIDVSKPNAHDFNELLRNVEHLKNTSMNMNVHQQGLYNDQK